MGNWNKCMLLKVIAHKDTKTTKPKDAKIALRALCLCRKK